MSSKKIVVANWKMNPASMKLAESLFKSTAKAKKSSKTTVVICPPFVYLNKLSKISKKIPLGVQNISTEESGPFTGEVSAGMAYDVGARYTIIGHSERRSMGETNEIVNKKIKVAVKEGLTPIVCVGESGRDSSHSYFKIVGDQLEASLKGIPKSSIENIIIAYEPVWSLSTTSNRHDATAEDSREMSVFIRKILLDKFGVRTQKSRVLYGGSVNERDAREFLEQGGVDGVLVGAASLNPKKFLEVIKISEE